MQEKITSLESRLKAIEERNHRVEGDKAWETSAMRKIVIFVITYIIASVWMIIIDESGWHLKALVPALGWYLSTLTIPFIKKGWIKKYTK